MGRIPLRKIIAAFWVGLALLAPVKLTALEAPVKVVPMGDNTYSVMRAGPHVFYRNEETIKSRALESATRFCEVQKKQLKVVSYDVDKPVYGMEVIKVTLVFKALDAGDPQLAASAPAAAATSQVSFGSGDRYDELLKLDELRKRGILTDKEFAAEKKKILKRSN